MKLIGKTIGIVIPLGGKRHQTTLKAKVKPYPRDRNVVRLAIGQDTGRLVPAAIVASCLHHNRPYVWQQ
jgi:hypothetical protein